MVYEKMVYKKYDLRKICLNARVYFSHSISSYLQQLTCISN